MFSEVIKNLFNNTNEVFEDAKDILLKIIDNILKNPLNEKVRSLNKTNKIIIKKVVSVPGAIECLLAIGFHDVSNKYILPMDENLDKLLTFKTELTSCHLTSNRGENFRKIELSPYESVYHNQFLKQIERNFHEALKYDDKDVHDHALSILPISKLNNLTIKKMREIQSNFKQKMTDFKDIDIFYEDLLLLELLKWFKEDFFTWVDSPDCEKCGEKSIMSHISQDRNVMLYTDRVEVHKCTICGHFTHFPRYTDLHILLEWRKGRCGEWASAFTLLCRALKFDARLVVDYNDHVWTEVFSFSQNRWRHCDPCENIQDCPLIYETGWGKKMSYVIAYSPDEVQDVTWRYSSQHRVLMANRHLISEDDLVAALVNLRNKRQNIFTDTRKAYLTKRILFELCDLMLEKKPNNGDRSGRISGAADWKVNRGENGLILNSNYTWKPKISESPLSVKLTYNCAADRYQFESGSCIMEQMQGWQNGIYQGNSVFRKEESDWKMVYLCRSEGTTAGTITWRFEAVDNFVIDYFEANINYKLFESGTVDVELKSEKHSVRCKPEQIGQHCHLFEGESWFTLQVLLGNGNGELAWQHAQLFRQSFDDDDNVVEIKIQYKIL